MYRLLFNLFGRQIVFYFGGLCFLSVAVLASLSLTSKYALKSYVSEQITRLPWDMTVIQQTPLYNYPELGKRFENIEGVKNVEALGFLRVQNGDLLRVEVNNMPLSVTWVGVIATSDSDLLPPELRRYKKDSIDTNAQQSHIRAAFVSNNDGQLRYSTINTGDVIKLQYTGKDPAAGHSHGEGDDDHESIHSNKHNTGKDPATGHLQGEGDDDHGSTHSNEHDTGKDPTAGHSLGEGDDDHGSIHSNEHQHEVTPKRKSEILQEFIVENQVSQLERLEFNKWMLSHIGSLSYLPEQALILSVPMPIFEKLAEKLDKIQLPSSGMHGTETAPPYIPEINHLIKLDHERWINPWDLSASIRQLTYLITIFESETHRISSTAYVMSDLRGVLTELERISRSVGLVAILIAIPLLWLAWMVARKLNILLLLNHQRQIGLVMMRGVPMSLVSKTLMTIFIISGFLGSILGMATGLGFPIIGYKLIGESLPSLFYLKNEVLYFLFFIVIGVILSVLSGRNMINHMRRFTPREVMTRMMDEIFNQDAHHTPKSFVIASITAFIIGGYKIFVWTTGYSLFPELIDSVSASHFRFWLTIEFVLNFIAVPLFLFGITGILRWRTKWFQHIINFLMIPFVGKFRWFAAKHMALNRTRIVGTMFLTALALSLTLLPQIAADSFYDRVKRGVKSSVGGDFQLEYNMAVLTGGAVDLQPVSIYNDLIKNQLVEIEKSLKDVAWINSVTPIQQYIIPSFYLPNQSGLLLNLIADQHDYLKNIYFEEELGITRKFTNIARDIENRSLIASQGLLNARKIPMDKDIVLGYGNKEQSLFARISDSIAFLPGQPGIEVKQREGFMTQEVDYLNYITNSDARLVTSLDNILNSTLNSLEVVPSRAVFVIKSANKIQLEELDSLIKSLPIQPQTIRSLSQEIGNVSKDMFISLSIENMWVFMIGGLVLAISGVLIIGWINFLANRHTFSLLRLRGMPLSMLFRISLANFLIPVIVGILLGIVLGAISGFGVAQAIWEMPKVYGVAGFLKNQLVFSYTAWKIVFLFCSILTLISFIYGLWPFRRTVYEELRNN